MFTLLAQPAPIGTVRATDVRHTSTAGKLCSELARGRGGDKRFCAWRSREVGSIRRATRSGRLYYRGRIAVPRCDAARSPQALVRGRASRRGTGKHHLLSGREGSPRPLQRHHEETPHQGRRAAVRGPVGAYEAALVSLEAVRVNGCGPTVIAVSRLSCSCKD